MKRYKTIDTVRLFSGLIGLDARQAKSRLQVGQITPAGVGVYEIMKPVQFKAGEIILLSDPKGPMHSLECLDIDLPTAEDLPAGAPVVGDEPKRPPTVGDSEPAAEPKRSPGRPAVARGGRK